MGKTRRYDQTWTCGTGRKRKRWNNRRFRQNARRAIQQENFGHFDSDDYRTNPVQEREEKMS